MAVGAATADDSVNLPAVRRLEENIGAIPVLNLDLRDKAASSGNIALHLIFHPFAVSILGRVQNTAGQTHIQSKIAQHVAAIQPR